MVIVLHVAAMMTYGIRNRGLDQSWRTLNYPGGYSGIGMILPANKDAAAGIKDLLFLRATIDDAAFM